MSDEGEVSSASDSGKQFDVSNILADYFKDKIRQGIGVGDDGESSSSEEGETKDNSGDEPSSKRSKRMKKSKKKKKHKHHSHHHRGHHYSKEDGYLSSSKGDTVGEYKTSSNINNSSARMKDSVEFERERDRHRERRYDRESGGSSSRRRSRSRDRDSLKSSKRRERRRSRSRDRDRSRSRSWGRRRDRSRSSGRFRSPLRVRDTGDRGARIASSSAGAVVRKRDDDTASVAFDKKELLEVARRNVKLMIQSGTLPKGVDVEKLRQDLSKEETNTTAESVDKFTEICRKIQETGDDDDGGSTAAPVSHPFQVKERPIRMNIPNAVQLPAKSFQEKIKDSAALTAQFPVSSGSSHRKNEMELDWKPVERDKDGSGRGRRDGSSAMVALNNGSFSNSSPRPVLSVAPISRRDEALEEKLKNMTIQQVMTKRVEALQKLQRDPSDQEARRLHEVTERVIKEWSRSKQQPGQLTNTVDTSVKFLSPAELQEGHQAWVKKDQLQKTRAVEGGIGMALLQKMGWTPGTALGKNRVGVLEPVLPPIKMDRKGLVAQEEAISNDITVNVTIPNRRSNNQLHEVQSTTLGGKHPVSALIELCVAERFASPEFVEMPAYGPDHKKTFQYRVTVNGKSYQPLERSPNKKLAKAAAALLALNEMGAVVGIEKAPRMAFLSKGTEMLSPASVITAPTSSLAVTTATTTMTTASTANPETADAAVSSETSPCQEMLQPLKCTDASKMASNFLTSFHVGGEGSGSRPHERNAGRSQQTPRHTAMGPPSHMLSVPPRMVPPPPGSHGLQPYSNSPYSMWPLPMGPPPNHHGQRTGGGSNNPPPYDSYFAGNQVCNF